MASWRRLGRALALVAAASTLSACGGGALSNPIAPAPTVRGSVDQGGQRPLLVDWGPNDRTLFNTSRSRGPLVVSYVGGKLEPLYNCHATGQYRYTPDRSAQVQDDIIDDVSELHAKMPTFGAKFEADLRRAGKLHVRMKVVGLYAADRTTFAPTDISGGECDRATHVATYVTIGAFRLFSLSRGDLKGDVEVPMAGGVSGGTHGSEQALNEAGDEKACDLATSSDKQPPDGCSTSLQLVVVPIAGSAGAVATVNVGGSVQTGTQPGPARSSEGNAGHGRRVLGLATGGVGLAGVVVGSIFGGLTLSETSSLNSACPSHSGCTPQAMSDHSDAQTYGTVSTASFIAGGVLLAGGLAIYFTAPQSHPGAVGLQVLPGGAGVTGSF